MSEPVKIAEDLQEMFEASKWDTTILVGSQFRYLIERVSAAEAALALAKEENGCLIEWKTAVSSAVKSIPQFSSGTWGGDKEGWGFHFEIVHWLRRSYAALEADRARLKAPLSDEEWRSGDLGGRIFRGYRQMFNDIIEGRSKAPDGAQEAEGE